jgi:hypothetical protein
MSAIDPSQAAMAFTDAVKRAATLHPHAVQYLSLGHELQDDALKIEQARVISRYGRNSAEAKAVQNRIAAHAARGQVIAAEMRRSEVPAPQPSPDAFIIYGIVTDEVGKPRKGIEVAAVRAGYPSLVTAITDPEGRFELDVPVRGKASSQKESASRAADRKARQKSAEVDKQKIEETEAQEAETPAAGLQGFQLVLTDKSKATYRYPEVFQPKGGLLAYREIAFASAVANNKNG